MNKISEIFNFDNIGGKIKNLAKWSCWITILLIWIATPISFIVLVSDDRTAELCWIPLVGAVVGPVVVWLGSWAMYAFGEFVEDIHVMRYSSQLKNIDKNVQIMADPIIREAEEKARHDAEAIAKREAEEKARHDAEAIAKREAEEKARHDAEAIAKRETAAKPKQVIQKKEKTLSEKLAYALMFQSDDGMVSYLKGLQDETVQDILKSPQHLIREQIKNLLAHL